MLTDDGWLEFQEYFVHRRQAPDVLEIRFAGHRGGSRRRRRSSRRSAPPTRSSSCPSNPIVSVGPILEVPGVREAISPARSAGIPVVAVSPIIGGKALKGPPTGCSSRSATSRRRSASRGCYADSPTCSCSTRWTPPLADAVEALGVRPVVTDTIMSDDAVARPTRREVLEAAGLR